MLALLVALHLICGLAVLLGGRRARPWIFAAAGLPMLVSAIAIATQVPAVLDGATPGDQWTWVEGLGLTLALRLDGFATLMALAVSVIGLVVIAYSTGYFAGHADPARTCRFAALLTWFAGAMLGLVAADSTWTLFVFWELTSVLSFLLIGLDDSTYATRTAALRALLVTAGGGLALLAGLVCIEQAGGDRGPLLQVGLVLALVGAFTKSAQVPFHFWLPGAMAAPTPVSAYLHSATMVKAGVILVARLAPEYAHFGWWRPLLVTVGGATMLLGGVAALRRDDAKQSLAFGTVSQLGLLVLLLGFGDPAVTAAGVAVLTAHVVFKCGLFLTVGAVDHATGTRSLTANSGVGRALPRLAGAAALCTLSMLGFPLLLGFAAKESALAALHAGGGAWARVALITVVVGSMLTVAYSVRLWWGLFGNEREHGGGRAHVHHRPGVWLTVPVYVLGLASLAGGLLAGPLGGRLTVASEALDHAAHAHLAVWPGFHAPLLLSALAIVGGLIVGVPVILAPHLPAFHGATIGESVFGKAYHGLLDGARSITLVSQSGSLPVYVAVIFTVVTGVITAGLAFGVGIDPDSLVVADTWMQAAVALMGVGVAVAAVTARRRFASVLLLGGIGMVVTVVFLTYGAPDLALTQFMIESLSIVAFLLVLRHLPHDFGPPPSWAPAALRIAISTAVGVTVAWFCIAAGSGPRPTDVTDYVNANSLSESGGANVVNMTVVDFRGVDTMFEITVFGTAALGIANLVAASRGIVRPDARRMARVGAHSMIFEQTTRMVFHLTLLVSVYVLLRGSNAPGGGFAGGLIAAAAFVFRLLAGSRDNAARARFAPPPIVLIALGILFAAGSGIGALIAGGEFLETAVIDTDAGPLGRLFVPTSLVFDLGVYTMVIGVVILVLGNLASRAGAAARVALEPAS